MVIKNNCFYFRGDIPCKPHKESGVHCDNCPYFKPIEKRIIIIKLGAIGDVIRTTPLLVKLREENKNAEISWLTYSPDVLSPEWVNNILDVSIENIEWLKNNSFDWLINLDKDKLTISLAKAIPAKRKAGFTMDEFGRCMPFETEAEKHKWLTGLWDDMSKINPKNYMEEIFEICGYKFENEEYILEDSPKNTIDWDINHSRKVVGLNTGCGGRWKSRLWPEEYWIELAQNLIQKGYEVVLLGGEQENEKNKRIAKQSGAKYFGHFDLKTFINLVNNVDLVVTAVTMTMHLAIGLKKKLVLFNNIFNRNEFYLYNRGVILEPEMECDCYYSPECKNECMRSIKVKTVFNNVITLLQ